MGKYKYLFYDFDGTLVNTYEGIAEILDITFAHYGIDVDKSLYPKYIGPPLSETFTFYMGKQKAYEAVEFFRDNYVNNKAIYKSCLYDGIKETLTDLKKKGYKICVASCKKHEEAVHLIDYYGISDCIDFVSGLCYNVRETKKEVLQYALDTLKIDSSECVMIGDTIFDVEGAEEVNMDCILCLWGFGEYDKINNKNVVYRAKDPYDTAQYILEE